MTYPQQPYGGQDPYGQQPGSGHGPYGPPVQYGHQPYGGGFPPPPKKKTGAIVAVVVVVVLVLGGLGFTGFVEPGFFVGEEGGTPGSTTPTSTSPSAEPAGADPEDFLRTLVDGLDTQDPDALTDLTCADSESAVDSAIDDIDSVSGAELVDSEEVSDDEVTATVEVTSTARTGEFEVTITRDGGDWCWQDITRTGGEEPTTEPSNEPSNDPDTPTAGGKPVDPEALAAMQSFLDSVNTGDAAAAKGALCGDAISTPAEVDELVGYEPSLEIDPSMAGTASGDRSVQLYLRGTANGQELEGYSTNLWVTNYDGPWCVHAFRAVVS